MAAFELIKLRIMKINIYCATLITVILKKHTFPLQNQPIHAKDVLNTINLK